MKIVLFALCLALVVLTIGYIVPNVGGPLVMRGTTPTPTDIRDSVFKGLPRGLQ
jgi:hypothetical protein